MHVKNTYILKTSRVSRREDAKHCIIIEIWGDIVYIVLARVIIIASTPPPSLSRRNSVFVVGFAIVLINVFGDLTSTL